VRGLRDLPWQLPLEEWVDDRLVEMPGRGLSRHVVRFVAHGGQVVALKEIPERLARREQRLLPQMRARGLPAVEALGVVAGRGRGLDAILLTRFLDGSSSCRSAFAAARDRRTIDRLTAAVAHLLVRLHRAGVMWGDCSPSNALIRSDGGTDGAHLVDAETAEVHDRLSTGQREYDLEVALGRFAGELLDLRAGGYLGTDADPFVTADDLVRGYRRQWADRPASGPC